MSPAEKAKAEAIAAVQDVKTALEGPELIEGMRRFQLRATLEYALDQIQQIQAVKKARKEKGP